MAFGAIAAQGASENCIDTNKLLDYKIVSDQKIILNFADGQKVMLLENSCPQLKFQNYFSYLPLDGTLCAKRDEIMTRTGDKCTITSIRALENPLDNQP